MKRFLFLAMLACAVLFTSSCSTVRTVSMQSDYTKSYVGHTYNDIVRSLGAPTRTSSDGVGGSILIYEKTSADSYATARDVDRYRGTYTPGAHTDYNVSYVHIYIDKDGNCYQVKTNHTKKVRQFALGKTIALGVGVLGAVVGTIVAVCTLR